MRRLIRVFKIFAVDVVNVHRPVQIARYAVFAHHPAQRNRARHRVVDMIRGVRVRRIVAGVPPLFLARIIRFALGLRIVSVGLRAEIHVLSLVGKRRAVGVFNDSIRAVRVAVFVGVVIGDYVPHVFHAGKHFRAESACVPVFAPQRFFRQRDRLIEFLDMRRNFSVGILHEKRFVDIPVVKRRRF